MEIVDINEANAITHAGIFHADEVFATYILSKVIDNFKLARVNEVPENFEGIIYDIGRINDRKKKIFDHHQIEGAGERNGVKYASAGLIWKEFGKQFLKKQGINEKNIDRVFEKIDKEIIQNIDGIDNGQKDLFTGFTINEIISKLNPNWDEDIKPNLAFKNALKLIEEIMNRYIEREKSIERASNIVKESIDKSKEGIIILDKFVPWQTEFFETPIDQTKDVYYVIYPSNRGGYNIQTIPQELGSFKSKQLFPEEWRGKTKEELIVLTKIKDVTFIHNAGFIGSTNSKESAISLAKLSMEKNIINN